MIDQLREREIAIPMEEAARYARKRVWIIAGTFILFYLLLNFGIQDMIVYTVDYFRLLITRISLSLEYIGFIFMPVIDFFALFDYPVLFFLGLIAGIFLHEFLHGVPAAIFSKEGFKAVSYGVYWKYLTPYTHCKEPLELKRYKVVLLTPGIVLGILPALVGIAIQNFDLMMFGVLFTIGALGDVMVYERIKNMDNKTLVKDHPKSMGLILIE